MKIIVIGSGGREHAVIWKLAQSQRVQKIWCLPGNAGIGELAECVEIKADDIEGVAEFALRVKPDLVVVTPDNPLVLGMVDRLEELGFKTFGPDKKAAIIEGSKTFAKNLMQKYGIPTAKYRVFEDFEEAKAYIEAEGAPIVIKADGLAFGKGVVVAGSVGEALEAAGDMLKGGKFGESGNRVVIEECMEGPEVSVLCFTDGKTIKPMLSSQDHKRAYDGDRGPNTGGMGAFAPSPKYTEEVARECMERIILPTMRAMAKEGRPFKGVLYFGLMLTEEGPRVVEYNCRLGDPETQAVLPLLKSDLADIFMAIAEERLDGLDIEWEEGSCCVIALTSGGYPLDYESGLPISGIEKASAAGGLIFHAGTALRNGRLVTAGGRVLNVCAKGQTLKEAAQKAYQSAGEVSFEKMHYRKDIGKK
jgi:phosphoribosylamine--glycine ligase